MLCGREGIEARLGAPFLWPGLIAVESVLALAVQRETPYACIVLAPFVAAMLPEALGRARVTAPLVPRTAGIAVVTVFALGLVLEAATAAPAQPDLSAYPTGALDALRAARGNVLNEYDWGGYLIRYPPEHPTFIAGAGATLFVPHGLADFRPPVPPAPRY